MKGNNIAVSDGNQRNINKNSIILRWANEGIITFTPSSSGRNNDWVLVLDATETDVSR
jgi:hypothetical protein